MNLNKKEEGKLNQIPNTEQVVIKVDNEVPKKLNKIEKDDKQSFEDFKNLYKGVIDMKCNQDYGTIEDKDLWEDCAKELFLKSKTYLLKGNEYKAEPIQKKTENKKVESVKEYNTIPEIKERLKEINKQLSYIKRRDAVSLSIGTEEEQEELYSERAKLNGKLRKLRNDAVNMDKLNPSDQVKLKDRLKDLHLWDGKDDTLQSALQSYRNHYIQQFEDKKIDHNIDSYKPGNDKATILEALVNFLNDNNITADNIDKNKDLVEKYLSDNKLGISAYIPTVYKVYKDDYGTIGRIIFYRSKSKWGFNASSIVMESNKINESFDLDLIEKNIKGKRLSDAARYLGALVNGDRNSFEIQGSELVSKLDNKDKVKCVVKDNDIIKSIVKDFTHLTDKTESLNKTCKNESYYIKLFNKDNTDIDTIEASTEQEAIKTAEEKMKEGWRAVVYNADNKEALYDYDPFEELEESLQEEEITPANIKEKALEILPKEDVDVKDSDLYIKVSDKSKELINKLQFKKLQFKNNGLLTTFRSPIDNEMWYDIPFANLDDYITSKTESNNNTYYYDIHIVEDEATGMGYSVFIKTIKHYDEDLDADAIVDEAIKQNRLEADEADYCDYVSEISEQEYKDAAPRAEVESKQIKIESTNKKYIATYKMPNGTFFELYKNNDKLVDQNGNEISEDELSNYEKVEKKIETIDNKDLEYKYMLLDRLKQDCEYFLGNGNGNAEHSLWAKDIDEQIDKMKEIYNSFSEEEKPDWITLEDINNYEKRMKEYNKDVKTEAVSQLDDTTMYVYENELTDKNIIAKLYRNKIYELIYKNNKKDLVKISNIALGQAECKSILSGHKFKIDIVDMVKDGRVIETDYTSNNKDIKTESVVSDYTLSEIKKIIDSDGNDFTMKISNSNIDVETKYLDIDREDLISIYNVLGGNKDELTESRPDKDMARAKKFGDSRAKLNLPDKFTSIDEIVSYLEKCDDKTDIMNINTKVGGFNRQLHNDMLDFADKFIKENGHIDSYIDKDDKIQPGKFKEFKQAMIDFVKNYNLKTESKEVKTEGTNLKRISRYNEFDNGHVLHNDWKKISDEEAEELAKQASIKDPTDVYYVQFDDIMNSSNNNRWYKGKLYTVDEINAIRRKEKEDLLKKVQQEKDSKTESKEGYQDKCCMCGTSNLNGCYSVLDEEGNVGSVCVDCGKKYSLPEIEKKINSDMKSESKVNLKEDQYEYNRRKGRPNVKKIAEDEYYDNQDYYDKNIHKYKDMEDFIYEEIADIAYEYNLKEKPAKAVCELVYLMAMKRI